MPGNKEKQLSSLNRVQLLREKQERARKNPQRPSLSSLKSPQDIRRWLPSLQRDIEIALGLLKCISFSARKMDDLRTSLDKLQEEYDKYIKKLQRLEGPNYIPPGTPRPYLPANTKSSARTSLNLPDVLPIVAQERRDDSSCQSSCAENPNTEPLVFCKEALVNYSDSD